ncbi:hypothetical protein LNP10_06970 [Apilactobacillus nanyangensis]|uniref:Uncharacterized protein n=1 Tax=Apilactobacillus nanyangensis TaxID=2799579 RepID=A0ABT0HZ76_9LACO|nr:hypothetical protein [Apilactobacillus nanyangensis]MCK8612229.1 hypothetical protein [Apilactobacillus nanyangensis]
MNKREFIFKSITTAQPKAMVDKYELDAQGALTLFLAYAATGYDEDFSFKNDAYMNALAYYRANNSLGLIADFFQKSSLGDTFLDFSSCINSYGEPEMTMITEHNASSKLFKGDAPC